MATKAAVKKYWEAKVCGATYGRESPDEAVDLDRMAEARYQLEPYIPPFADFPSARGKRVLELGVGGGIDFSHWIMSGADATGVDLTEAGVRMTRARLERMQASPKSYRLFVGDAENLAIRDATFDIAYSFGVLHHSPDTARTFREVHRVLKPGGVFRGMIYHVYGPVMFMMWLRYGPLAGRPFKSIREAVFENLESPGTKVYTRKEASELLRAAGFSDVKVFARLSFGDLLLIKPGRRYQSLPYRIWWRIYPRWLIRLLGRVFKEKFGGPLFFTVRKAASPPTGREFRTPETVPECHVQQS
jgi:ubiquinone/menaquinone biosynthesis C-methylase UbiE